MGHRLRKSFVRNAFIPDLEVNNKSKGYGVSQRLKKSKSWNQIKITYKNNFHGFRTNLGITRQKLKVKNFDLKKIFVSKSFSLWLKSPKKGAKSLS